MRSDKNENNVSTSAEYFYFTQSVHQTNLQVNSQAKNTITICCLSSASESCFNSKLYCARKRHCRKENWTERRVNTGCPAYKSSLGNFEGVDGRSLAEAVNVATVVWVFPWVSHGDGVFTWRDGDAGTLSQIDSCCYCHYEYLWSGGRVFKVG